MFWFFGADTCCQDRHKTPSAHFGIHTHPSVESLLKYPFILKKRISKVGPDYSQSVRRIASSFQAPGTRLRRKLRKRLYKLGALSLYSSHKQQPSKGQGRSWSWTRIWRSAHLCARSVEEIENERHGAYGTVLRSKEMAAFNVKKLYLFLACAALAYQ